MLSLIQSFSPCVNSGLHDSQSSWSSKPGTITCQPLLFPCGSCKSRQQIHFFAPLSQTFSLTQYGGHNGQRQFLFTGTSSFLGLWALGSPTIRVDLQPSSPKPQPFSLPQPQHHRTSAGPRSRRGLQQTHLVSSAAAMPLPSPADVLQKQTPPATLVHQLVQPSSCSHQPRT